MSGDCSTKFKYLSRQVADNAAWLHTAALPTCPGVRVYWCRTHEAFHLGHKTGKGAVCKERQGVSRQ